MRGTILSVALAASLVGSPFMVGCDREVAHSEKTTTDSSGRQAHTEQTTVQHPDGTTSTSTEKHTTTTPPPPAP